ncbi:MAG: bacteriophage abortive infection AbiH family protein [Bacillota bacterium]|nr:bacteriophage abortive infection AbiH family protein [Bacillota bacterium]
MTNLTIIYGNGFDINLGLNTKFVDFYKWLESEQKHAKDKIYQFIKNEKSINYLNWSDLEVGLGNYTLRGDFNPDEFMDSHDNLLEDLNEYLLLEQEKFETPPPTYRDGILLRTLREIPLKLSATSQKKEAISIQNAYDRGLDINFISFNYTQNMEKIIYEPRILKNGPSLYQINMPIHIHGILKESKVLGVNDSTQYAHNLFDKSFEKYFVKNSLLKSISSSQLDDSLYILNNSDIVLLFGMSLGNTDKFYWEEIFRWLHEDNERILLLHDYERELPINGWSSQRLIDTYLTKSKNKFFKSVGIAFESDIEISKQILPLYGTEFFTPIK